MKIQVGTAQQYQDIDAGVTLLAVPFQILDDADVVVQDRVQSFPLDATQEDITELLNRSLQVYKDNVATHEAAKVLQAGMDNADAVASQISGLTINE